MERTSVWRHPNFLILFLAGAVMAIGGKIYELALPLLLYERTGSAVAMSVMRGIEFLPNLALAMWIGVLVDRARKKRWSIWSVLLQLIVLLGIYASAMSHHAPLIFLYAGGFLLMTGNYAYVNARFGLVKQALPGDLLTAANASFHFVVTLVAILGPAITGLLLTLSSPASGLLLTAAACGGCAAVLLFLRTDEPERLPARDGWRAELRAGWEELKRNRRLWLITIAVIFLNATAGMVEATVVYFAKDTLRLGNAALGMVLSAGGAGGLLGSLAVGRLRRKFPAGLLITAAVLFTGISYAVLAVSQSAVLFACGMLLMDLFSTISSICIWTYRQESTPPHLIGRISGITGSAFKLAMPFAMFAAGWIAEAAHPTVVFGLSAAGNLVIFACCRASALWRDS